MKTDIAGFTSRVEKYSDAELSALLVKHSNLINSITNSHGGHIVKGEGDSFWLIFPSVTDAARAAIALHDELRFTQAGKTESARMAIRIVISLGEVLHQENDIFGDVVNLTARIEKVTPPDEIYLSPAAWLTLNKSEIQTSYVNEFKFHGISEPISVYKIEHGSHTRITRQQTIVLTDLLGFSAFYNTHSIAEVEETLLSYYAVHNSISAQFGGIINLVTGDSFTLTFPTIEAALNAVTRLCCEWEQFRQGRKVSCLVTAGIHQGDVYAFRSFLFGEDINVAGQLVRLTRVNKPQKSCALVSKVVAQQVISGDWGKRLRQMDITHLQGEQPMTVYDLIWDS